MPNLYTVPPMPTREQIEAYRKEHMMYRHADGAGLEPWAIEENMVLNYLCSLALGQLPTYGQMSVCPCTLVEPCSPNCSCAQPFMSGGCARCATYGSREQQLYAARSIAERLARPEVVPLCDGCAQAWLTERNHLKGDHDCVVCAFLGNKRTPMNSPEPKGPTNA